eukprot:CAMPEP_0176497250 /NCGR_PEP_ID=MMETSP0200_2-20121128/11621_1 /TAXON_ID=947934 /ORGANISM="Chaetoceros sp., Strain GSL56" /LENGTH=439 /DNA_ID=CAMNT_0017895245 /DNA_START=65 /DNA_END=1381 /DNA_ORIENTATION=-
MSRRPRLVKEGTPIDEQTTTNQESTDEFLESEYQKAVRKEQDRHHPSRRYHAMIDDYDHDRVRSDSSSLERAAINRSFPREPLTQARRHVLQTKIEIGGDTNIPLSFSAANTAHVPTRHAQYSIPKQKLVTKFEIGENLIEKERSYSDGSSTSMMDVDHNIEHNTFVSSSRPSSIQQVSLPQQIDDNDLYEDPSERMEIDDTHLQRLPLVVLDGANIAYAYSQATETTETPLLSSNGGVSSYLSSSGNKNGLIPNVLGIQIAVSYFLHGGCRVQVVVPVYWMRRKPPTTSNGYGGPLRNASVVSTQQLDILNRLKEQNILCCSPPTDDDDAYCISIARRIDARFQARTKTSSSLQSYALSHFSANADDGDDDLTRIGGAYILSNDLFRDAKDRDISGDLTRWLDGDGGMDEFHRYSLPRRISYSFADLGSMNKYGDAQL